MIGLRPDVDASFRETSDQFQKRSDKLRDKNRRKIRLNHLFFIAIHRNVQCSLIIEYGRITFLHRMVHRKIRRSIDRYSLYLEKIKVRTAFKPFPW